MTWLRLVPKGIDVKDFGNKIKELRKGGKLSLAKLEKISGVSRSYIWNLENGLNHNPSIEKLSLLSKALGVSIDYFLDSSSSSVQERHIDDAFFEDYKNLEPEKKEHLRQILGTFK